MEVQGERRKGVGGGRIGGDGGKGMEGRGGREGMRVGRKEINGREGRRTDRSVKQGRVRWRWLGVKDIGEGG